MSQTRDSTLTDPQQTIADLQRANAELPQRLDASNVERDEVLEQQTAAAEVLQVINSSDGHLAPVFDTILEKAHTLCGAAHGIMMIREGERFRTVAVNGVGPDFVDAIRQLDPMRPPEGSGPARLIQGEQVVQFPDLQTESFLQNAPPHLRRVIEIGDVRTLLMVPLRNDDAVIGIITAFRQEVRPFSDKQIALLENFAAQAVIAMQNARLLIETREALEQQTATAEILRVIASSPADLQPTFDTIAGAAKKLTDAALGSVVTYDGRLMHLAALAGFTPDEIEQIQEVFPIPADHGTATGRAILTRQVAHIENLAADAERGYPTLDQSSGQTVLAVPMLRDGVPIGAINVQRRRAEPFTDQQIDLIGTFADQAVIAMENARLLTETREALEQQIATAEVLQVINASPADLAPVFDVILERAIRLCEAEFGLMLTVDGAALMVAERDVPKPLTDFLAQHPPDIGPDTFFGRAVLGRSILHTADMREEAAYRSGQPLTLTAVNLAGVRALLMAPLLKEDSASGVFAIFRREPRPFSKKQIMLLENFAAQAVIAMETARLLTETREALEQQTATAEVLQVINSSPGDLKPVFDTILEKAHTLCGAAHGDLMMYDGEHFRGVAFRGTPEPFADLLRQPLRPSENHQRLLQGERLIHTPDVAAVEPTGPIHRAAIDAVSALCF